MAGRIAAILVVTVAFFGPISAVTVNGPCDSTDFEPYSNFRLGEVSVLLSCEAFRPVLTFNCFVVHRHLV